MRRWRTAPSANGSARPTSVIQLTELPSPKRSLRPTALPQRTRYAHGPNVPTALRCCYFRIWGRRNSNANVKANPSLTEITYSVSEFTYMFLLRLCGTRVAFDALMRAAGGMESILVAGQDLNLRPSGYESQSPLYGHINLRRHAAQGCVTTLCSP